MKKKMIGIVIAGLIGTYPLSTYAVNDILNIPTGKLVSIISQHNQRPDHDQKHGRDNERRDQERKEEERRKEERFEKNHRGHDPREDRRREEERREIERREEERREQRNDASYIIHRTADVIVAAQRSTGRRHYYKGMGQAVAHQQKARQLFMGGFYKDAIFHSLRARRIAIGIIQGNRGKWSGSWDDREERYRCNGPRDNDLDIKLNLIKIGDKEAVRISVDLDL